MTGGVRIEHHSSVSFPLSVAGLRAWTEALPPEAVITAEFKETGSQRDPVIEGKALHADWTETVAPS